MKKLTYCAVFVLVFFVPPLYGIELLLNEIGISLKNPVVGIAIIPLVLLLALDAAKTFLQKVEAYLINRLNPNLLSNYVYDQWITVDFSELFSQKGMLSHLKAASRISSARLNEVSALADRDTTPCLTRAFADKPEYLHFLYPKEKHELLVTANKTYFKEKGWNNGDTQTLRELLTVYSFWYGYEIPANMVTAQSGALTLLFAMLIKTAKVDKQTYLKLTKEKEKELQEYYEKVPSSYNALLYDLYPVRKNCAFYLIGNFVVENNIIRSSPNARPIEFGLFLLQMKINGKDIFRHNIALVADEPLPEDYRMAMTINFMRAFGWVPFDYVSYNPKIRSTMNYICKE